LKNTFQVRVTNHGAIIIPRKLREKYSVEDGAILALTDLGNGVIVLRPRRPGVNEIAGDLSKQWQASGMSLETMLGALREVRTEFDAN
jgi:bifunctional DNA-binding transcriptional regulator/antitoxin component of YhaV-PrlF toxin-antitoxin module